MHPPEGGLCEAVGTLSNTNASDCQEEEEEEK